MQSQKEVQVGCFPSCKVALRQVQVSVVFLEPTDLVDAGATLAESTERANGGICGGLKRHL